jgi:hypothetical protein
VTSTLGSDLVVLDVFGSGRLRKLSVALILDLPLFGQLGFALEFQEGGRGGKDSLKRTWQSEAGRVFLN